MPYNFKRYFQVKPAKCFLSMTIVNHLIDCYYSPGDGSADTDHNLG